MIEEAHKGHGDQADELQPAFQSIKAGSDCGWPYTRNRYIFSLGTDVMAGLKSLDEPAFKSLAEAPYKVYPEHNLADYNPNPLQSFNDFSKVCRPDVPLAIV